MCGEVGRHLVEGISDGFVPGIFARHQDPIDEMAAMDSVVAIVEMRRLAREPGLFPGLSSGAHVVAAGGLRARYPGLWHVVTFTCDEGERNTSTTTSSAPDQPWSDGGKTRRPYPHYLCSPREEEPRLIRLRLNIRPIRADANRLGLQRPVAASARPGWQWARNMSIDSSISRIQRSPAGLIGDLLVDQAGH
jgi:hypothetical protein